MSPLSSSPADSLPTTVPAVASSLTVVSLIFRETGASLVSFKLMEIASAYEFFKTYCEENNVEVVDYPSDRLIQTMNIANLKVIDKRGKEIIGQLGCNVSGMDNDTYEIAILGVPYPFYEEEFPHHVKSYNDMFKNGK